MSFLSPASLAWLALLVPLVVLYILKRRRERRVIGSTMLWEAALRDLRAERPWKRLIPHLSLILQALVIIAGAVALSRPAGAGQVPAGARLAVVVDTSASMAAMEEGGSRMELARSAARSLARSLPAGGEMMLVEAAAEPTVLTPPTRDAANLERALERLATRGGGADLEAAVALASERLRSAPAGSRIVLLTDAAVEGAIPLASDVPVEVQRVGTPLANTAIVALDVRARPTEQAPDRADVFARVARFGEGEREVWVTASLDGGGVIASRRIRVRPGEPEAVVLAADLPPDASGRAAVVRVELSEEREGGESGDAFALDDVAVAPSPAGRRMPVFLIGAAPPPLRRVLRADRDLELFATDLEALARRREEEPDAPELDGLSIDCGATPTEAPPGDSVVVAPAGDAVFGVSLGEPQEGPRVVSWDEGDPRLRFVRFSDLHLRSARPIEGAAAHPLLTTDAGPIIASLLRPDGETTIVSFDPVESDWPTQPGFVVFFRNLLERARGRRAAGGIAPGGLGAPLRVPAPNGEEVVVRAPDGRGIAATSRGGIAVVPVPALPGVYHAEVGRRRLHALRNLLDPAESDLTPRARFTEREGGTEVTTSERHEHAELWPWLVAALLALLALDILWATRRTAA